jgi:hypothetical protein
MIKAEKICYLDFDGVLHDEEVYFHPKRGIYMKTPDRVLFEWLPILDELMAPHPDVRIVLSTSWVHAKSFNYAKYRLTPALQEKVIGSTFHRREMRREEFVHLPRGKQIANDVFRRGPKSWFAIDDDHENWPEWCRNNLICTDGGKGISDPEIQRAIGIMLERF